MIKSLYKWTMHFAGHRHAFIALFFITFLESAFFPLPPDVLFIAMVLAARPRAWRIAAIATAGSVAGGACGYLIGHFLFQILGQDLVDYFQLEQSFAAFKDIYIRWGWWIVIVGGITPIPYKLITIASGVFNLNFFQFMLASLVARSVRFLILAALLWRFGETVHAFIERNLKWVFFGLVVFFVGIFFLVRYLF